MRVSDLVKNIRHPHAGIGIVIVVGSREDYVIAVWPGWGLAVAYADEVEVISEGW